jgi:hypothetical protein
MTEGSTDHDRSDTPADSAPWRPRSLDELTPEEREQLDRELDSGVTELPPNQIQGLLGEKNPSLYKVDEPQAGLNAGLSQDDDDPVRALVFFLAYLVFFPLAYVLLWRSQRFSLKYKIIVSAVMTVGVLLAAAVLSRR